MPADIPIVFEGLDPTAGLRAHVRHYIAELARTIGPVATCRVALTSPDSHHRDGGAYKVDIRLALPEGRHIHVSRTAHAGESPDDREFAVRDAFRQANRALRDRLHQMTRGAKRLSDDRIGSVDGDTSFVEAANASEIIVGHTRRGSPGPGARRTSGDGLFGKPRRA